jgi:hypothetical protein
MNDRREQSRIRPATFTSSYEARCIEFVGNEHEIEVPAGIV